MKKQNLLVLASLVAVSGLIVGQSVLASPVGTPSPDTNATNATFNSLSLINSSGKEYLKVKSMDPLGMHTVMESPDGYINLNDSLNITNGNIVVDRTIYAKQSVNSGDEVVARGRLWSQGLNGYGGGVWLDLALEQFMGDASDVSPFSSATGFWINKGWRMIVNSFGQISNPTGDVGINDSLDIRGDIKNDLQGKSVVIKDVLEIDGPRGQDLALDVSGRIRSGSNSRGGEGGMWLNNLTGAGAPASSQFVGSKDNYNVGFYNNGWGLTVGATGNVEVQGSLAAGGTVQANQMIAGKGGINTSGTVVFGELRGGAVQATTVQASQNLQTNGHVTAGGSVSAQRFIGRCNSSNWAGNSFDCQDSAEIYQTSEKTVAGDILMLDAENPLKMKLAEKNAAGKLTGVVSTSAGVILSANGPVVSDGNNESYITAEQTLLVLTGKAPVKVNNENGAIKVGDYITASSTPGVGMKANAGDQVVGIAMENFDSAKQGSVLILSDKSGALSMVKDELSKKINALEARLHQLEKLLVK